MQDDDLVLPSSLLELADDQYYSGFNKTYNNVALKIGVVKNVYNIDNPRNISKKAPEYDVLAFEQDLNKGVTPITFKNCLSLDSFGAIADFFEFRKIIPTDSPDNAKLDKNDGSYVLLLCIDGSNSKGVIIGALPHHNRKPTLTKDAGHHMEGEYNGLRIKVNKDGELTITFKGATDNKGKPKDPAKGGSQIKMEKDGSIELNDRDLDGELKAGNNKEAKDDSKAGDQYEKIRIDKTKQGILLNTRKDFTETIGANSSTSVKGNTTHKTTDLLVECSGKANYAVKGAFDIKADGELSAKAPSGKLIFDDALQIMATSMQVNAQTINLGVGGLPALNISTTYLGIGNLGGPIISTVMSGFSSTVFIAP